VKCSVDRQGRKGKKDRPLSPVYAVLGPPAPRLLESPSLASSFHTTAPFIGQTNDND